MQEETQTEAAALAQLMAQPKETRIEGVPAFALPPGHTLELHEALLPEPRRIKAAINAHEIGGLISYVNRFKSDRTALYCGPREQPKILARIDDNQAGKTDGANEPPADRPSHVTHSCTFSCPTTVEWKAWTGQDKKALAQVAFAEFIERNIRDVAEPNGPDFLAAVLTFQDTGRAEFRSAVRLNDGRVQYQYVEKEDAGQITFPAQLKVAVPVFEGQSTRYAMAARLRYRIDKEGGLAIWYELDRPDLVLRAAYDDLLAQVEKETGLQVHRAL